MIALVIFVAIDIVCMVSTFNNMKGQNPPYVGIILIFVGFVIAAVIMTASSYTIEQSIAQRMQERYVHMLSFTHKCRCEQANQRPNIHGRVQFLTYVRVTQVCV